MINNPSDNSIISPQQPDYSSQDFLSEIRLKLQDILRRTFAHSLHKQEIKEDSLGLVVACPYCHDSATDVYKKRGHIILKDKWAGYYKCFNCGTFVSIPKFMNDFQETLTLSGVKYIQEHTNDIRSFNASSAEVTADIFQKENALKWSFDREWFRKTFNLFEIDRSPRVVSAYNYLVGRMQYNFEKFMYDPRTNCLLILNLVSGRILGLQIRRLNKNVPKGKRFLTMNLSRIYKEMLKRTDVEVPDELNTVSTLFDLYNVDVYSPILVTEGPMDAFLLPNAIATSGANKKLSVELPFWYIYDSDKTGMDHAMKMLEEKKKVFLWGRLEQDIGLPKRDKWDVNDVLIWCRDNKPAGFKIRWLDYFSDNPLDKLFMKQLSMNI